MLKRDTITSSPLPKSGQNCGFVAGDRVFLMGARFGLPGTVLRLERGKVVTYWGDMDHTSRHRPCTLILAGKVTDGDPR